MNVHTGHGVVQEVPYEPEDEHEDDSDEPPPDYHATSSSSSLSSSSSSSISRQFPGDIGYELADPIIAAEMRDNKPLREEGQRWIHAFRTADAFGYVNNRDPVLFPRNESVPDVHNDEPLFGPVLPSAAEALIDQHMNSQMERFHTKVNKPTRDEYRLALSCVPIVAAQYNRDPLAWAREERETLERQMAMMDRVEYRPSNFKRLAPAPSKKTTTTAQSRASKTSRPRRTPKSTPQQRALDTFEIEYSPSSKPLRTIGTNRDDTDYNSLKDFSPPLETLAGNTKGLKADWKGQMLDLSNDPDRGLLDPAEVNLAATLRLSCATYLCSKRRIFEARVKALSIGKEFRKTDAQQACKIDVNKASKLWTAYDRVGWFKPEHFAKFLKA